MHPFSDKCFSWLGLALYIQLALVQLSLPLLIAWNIPVSALTVVSNIIFLPFLVIILLLGISIFFGEIIGLPTIWLKYGLNHASHIWMNILSLGSHKWLIGLTSPSNSLLWIVTIASFVLLVYTATWPVWHRVLVFFLVLMGTLFFFHYITPIKNGTIVLKHKKRALIIERSSGYTSITDYGLFAQRNPDPWILYSLRPELIKVGASIHIQSIVCTKPTRTVVKTLTALLRHTIVNTIYLPIPRTKQTQFKEELKQLKKVAHQVHTTVLLHYPGQIS